MSSFETAAAALADRELFRARLEELLVDVTVAARRITTHDPRAVAWRALELIFEDAKRT